MDIKTLSNIPPSEYSQQFFQGMVDRMAMSYFKYGAVAKAYPSRINALSSMRLQVEEYLKTGNTEKLIDAANYLMIEFMHPSLKNAEFAPNDSGPGRTWHGEVDPSNRGNDPDSWKD